MRVLLAILLAAAAPAMHHKSADMKTARASLVTAADLGKGWTGKASPQEGATFGCNGYRPSGAGIVETGGASSAALTYDTTGPFVLQKTSVYASAGQANTYWQRAVRPGLIACAVQTLEQVTTRGIKLTITAKGTLPFSSSLSHTAAYRVVGTLESGKNKIVNYFDVIVLGQGKTITAITISSFKFAPPKSFERIVARIVAEHLNGSPVA
jgi:hypothetical protein